MWSKWGVLTLHFGFFSMFSTWFGLPDTRHHAAAWQRSCRCSFSTPWSIATTIRGTSTTTASSCLRWERLCPTRLRSREASLGGFQKTWLVVLSAGSRSSSSLFHVGGSRLPEGDGAAQPLSRWLHHGEPLNLRGFQTQGNNRFRLIPATFKHVCVFYFQCRSISSWTWLPAP